MQVKCWSPHMHIVQCILAVDYEPGRLMSPSPSILFAILRLLALTLIVDEPREARARS
jgi:hypothetical protein